MTHIETIAESSEGTPTPAITDATEGRDAVVAEVRRRWLGPLDGDNEVLQRSPVYAYLVGTLYPVEQGAATAVSLDEVEDATVVVAGEEAIEWESEDGTDDAEVEDLGVNLTGAFGWAAEFTRSFFSALWCDAASRTLCGHLRKQHRRRMGPASGRWERVLRGGGERQDAGDRGQGDPVLAVAEVRRSMVDHGRAVECGERRGWRGEAASGEVLVPGGAGLF